MVTFHLRGAVEDRLLKYAVIAARFQGHWIFCRHRKRHTWELPGGHREPGETLEQTARRELWEETGADQATLHPVCVYGVTSGEGTEYGLLFYAEVVRLGPLPTQWEMEERRMSDRLPGEMTYPQIQPALFEKVQGWLNLQTSPEETWDIYDENRVLTGRLHRRGDPLAEGDYHLVVDVWILGAKGFLLTKRSPNKGYGNLWEMTGGSALAGEDSLTAALREAQEETGLILDPNRGVRVLSVRRRDFFRDVWLFRQDYDLAQVILQPGETCDKRCGEREEILALRQAGEFVPCDYLEAFLEKAGL